MFDPEAQQRGRAASSATKVSYAAKSYDALRGADALAIVTEWHEFREPDFARMRKLMRAPVIFDGRNIYQPQQMKAHGFTYYSIGQIAAWRGFSSPAGRATSAVTRSARC